MRARHRHFNPQATGATYAWDTRFNKDSLTDNASVGTWTDRIGNTATQTSTSSPDRRPKWKDNSTDNINGSPVVVFDGTDDVLNSASTTTTGSLTCISVVKRPWTTGKFSPIFATDYRATQGKGFLSTGGAFQDFQNKDMFGVGNGADSGRAPRAIGSYGAIADNTPQIMTLTLSSGVSRIWDNAVRISTRVESTGSVPSTTAVVQIGASSTVFNDFGDMSFGTLQYWRDQSLSDALRKRLEHSAAYSFKIACS